MATAILPSATEYLATVYRPDREYIDGHVVERNWGEWDHGWMQGEMLLHFAPYRSQLRLYAVPEQRVQVKANRFRIPDVCVVSRHPGEQVLTRPPLLCIEILSPDDSMSSMQERLDDYLEFGVGHVWIIDPRRRKAYWADANGIHEFTDAVLVAKGTPIRIELADLWPVQE